MLHQKYSATQAMDQQSMYGACKYDDDGDDDDDDKNDDDDGADDDH